MTDLVQGATRTPAPGQRWANIETPGSVQLGTAATTIYTAPNTVNQSGAVVSLAILVDMWVANVDLSAARLFTLYVVPSGGTAGDANAVIPTCSMKATESVHYGVLRTLIPAGGTLQGKTDSANKITVTPTLEVIR